VPKGAFEANAPAVRAARKFNAAIAECYWDDVRREVALDVKDMGNWRRESEEQVLKPQSSDVALVLHTRQVDRSPYRTFSWVHLLTDTGLQWNDLEAESRTFDAPQPDSDDE
jgi:hypothetical protein